MRMPNGYGSIHKRKKRARKPFFVRAATQYIVDEKTGNVKEVRESVGNYATMEEALKALNEYNRRKNILKSFTITFEELFEKWSEEKYMSVGEDSVYSYNNAFKVFETIHKKKMLEITLADIQIIIDNCNKNYPTLKTFKSFLRQMYSYAMMYDLVEKDISLYVNIRKFADKNPNKLFRDRFDDDIIDQMWNNVETLLDRIPLMLIYSGTRICEMLDLEKKDVHLNKNYFHIRESKTESGIRDVPISKKIKQFFEDWINSSEEDYIYVFHDESGNKLTYSTFMNRYYNKIFRQRYKTNLTPHCTRHTCITKMVEADINPTYIKWIVGHKGSMSLAERRYTHVSMDRLVEEINKI